MQKLEFVLNKSRKVKLTAYLHDADYDLPAMLVLPGGGYVVCAPAEGEPPALEFYKAGYQAFVLEYTIGKDCEWPVPLDDYEMAAEFIEVHTSKWHIDPNKICCCGFSAGAHIAGCAATIAKHKPAATLLIYPALLDNILALLKDNLPEVPPLVDSKTAPCFLAAARDDRTVPINNTIQMHAALAENKIPFECHIYSFGGHAFGTGKQENVNHPVCNRVQNWVPDAIEWLTETIGTPSPEGFKLPEKQNVCTGDEAPQLSLMCSLGHILDFINTLEVPDSDKDAAKNYIQPITDALEQLAKDQNIKIEAAQISYLGNNLREICDAFNIPIDTARQIHDNLRTINNSNS